MNQKGFTPIIVALIIALITIVGLVIYKPNALEGLVATLLNKNETENQPVPQNKLPTTIPEKSPKKIPATKTTPTISTPASISNSTPIPTEHPTTIPTTQPTIAPTPYPTSSANWEEGPPDKKDKPFVGG